MIDERYTVTYSGLSGMAGSVGVDDSDMLREEITRITNVWLKMRGDNPRNTGYPVLTIRVDRKVFNENSDYER